MDIQQLQANSSAALFSQIVVFGAFAVVAFWCIIRNRLKAQAKADKLRFDRAVALQAETEAYIAQRLLVWPDSFLETDAERAEFGPRERRDACP